jgi:large subunit ribosomal protein L18
MKKTAQRLTARKQRQSRVRRKISGTCERPRLAIFRSSRHIYVQAIDDESQTTLASAGTIEKELTDSIQGYSGNQEAAGIVGKKIAERLLQKSISSVVFDRGGFLYHGRVKALAEGAREAGLKF